MCVWGGGDKAALIASEEKETAAAGGEAAFVLLTGVPLSIFLPAIASDVEL